MTEVCALFISDLHLQPAHPATSAAFFDFLERHARHAQQLYLLGDLFEYWAGDDDLADPFHAQVVAALRAVSEAGVTLYWIAGNRDFLVGARFAEATGLTLLPETWVAEIGGQKVVVLHGDAQCTQDTKYIEFRNMVRQAAWQAQFTALPLAQRKAIIAGLRADSRKEQGGKSYDIMDVTPAAIDAVFAETGADVMIHGHTHRPALHLAAEGGKRRYVLPDWEPDASPPRGGWIAMDADGVITRHDLSGAVIA
jgi:UDP-2,3-diacylglucosamine hydrolase